MTSDAPIFVVGAPRSGTTLLQFMLKSHPSISFPSGESHFIVPALQRYGSSRFESVESVREALEFMYKARPDFFQEELHGFEFDAATLAPELFEAGCHDVATVISGMFAKNCRGEGKNRWGERTPYYVLHMPLIKKFFPNAQFIHMIRDGRDVALSVEVRANDFGIYNDYISAEMWVKYVDEGKRLGAQLGQDYIEVRYEDLISEPETVMKKITTFLGEEYDAALVNYKKTSGPADKDPLLTKPVDKANKNKWAASMSADRVRVFESVAASTLVGCGYELGSKGKRLSLPFRAYYRLHNKFRRRQRERHLQSKKS